MRRFAIHTRRTPVSYKDGDWACEEETYQVEVMATAKNYAMVRRKGCIPFVLLKTELKMLLSKHSPQEKK